MKRLGNIKPTMVNNNKSYAQTAKTSVRQPKPPVPSSQEEFPELRNPKISGASKAKAQKDVGKTTTTTAGPTRAITAEEGLWSLPPTKKFMVRTKGMDPVDA